MLLLRLNVKHEPAVTDIPNKRLSQLRFRNARTAKTKKKHHGCEEHPHRVGTGAQGVAGASNSRLEQVRPDSAF
jgi:hypothetical protein